MCSSIRDTSLAHLAADTLAFLCWTRRRGIDTIVDLELFSRFTALLTGLSGAERRVGFHRFHNEGLYRGEMLTHRVAYNPHIHIAKNFVALVDALLAPQPQVPYSKTAIADDEIVAPVIRPSAETRTNVFALIRGQIDFDPQRQRLVLINPNASELLPHRRWMPERYGELIRRVIASHADVIVGITGAPNERAEAEAMAAACGPRCFSLAGKTELAELPALYAQAVAMVTNDSGPSHFSAATGLPTIVLFGPETPKLVSAARHLARDLRRPRLLALRQRRQPSQDRLHRQRLHAGDQRRRGLCHARRGAGESARRPKTMSLASLDRRMLQPFERLFDALVDPARRARTMALLLIAYAAAWTIYGVIAKGSQDIHFDMGEMVVWSRETFLTTPNHPPLGSLLVRLWFSVFPLADWSYYVFAILFAVGGLWFAWKSPALSRSGEGRGGGRAAHLRAVLQFPCAEVRRHHGAAAVLGRDHLVVPALVRDAAAGLCGARGARGRGLMLGKYWSAVLLIGLGIAVLCDPRRAPIPLGRALGDGRGRDRGACSACDRAPMGESTAVGFAFAKYAALDRWDALLSGLGYVAALAGYAAGPFIIAAIATRPSLAASRHAVAARCRPAAPVRGVCRAVDAGDRRVLIFKVRIVSVWGMAGLTLLRCCCWHRRWLRFRAWPRCGCWPARCCFRSCDCDFAGRRHRDPSRRPAAVRRALPAGRRGNQPALARHDGPAAACHREQPAHALRHASISPTGRRPT